MRSRKLGLLLGLALVAAAVLTAGASAQTGSSSIPVIADSSLNPTTTTIGGASVLPTTRTVPHWWGSTLDPHNGVTYGYNMVGANPNTCSGSACSSTVTTDITPLNVVVNGRTFSGSQVVGPTLSSPMFATNDYGSTPAATAGDSAESRGAGGVLSQQDAGVQLQEEDAMMRAQFNKTGSSSYHLILDPVVHPAVTIVVPGNKGYLLQSGRGVVFADVNIEWWATQIQNLNASLGYNDPTHLAVYLTQDVVNFVGANSPGNCCVIGFHGAGEVAGYNAGSTNGQGNNPVQTYAWASYTSPGFFARPNGGRDWALQDIHALSHEIGEWGDDPFINNYVEPWVTPTAPQYGCTNILETGDPVVAIGFAMGTNTYNQGPNPNGTQSADGYYHPEDEVYLPWFLRLDPNTVSEPTQSGTNGRYTLMGDLNRYAGFGVPATGC